MPPVPRAVSRILRAGSAVALLALLGLSGAAFATAPRAIDPGAAVPGAAGPGWLRALDDLRARAAGSVETILAADGGSVATLRGALAPPDPGSPRLAADRFLSANAAIYGGSVDLSDLRLAGTRVSPAGRHFRYRQVWRGLPVFDAGVDVHLSPAGVVFLLHNRFAPGIDLDAAASVPAAEAGERAVEAFARARRTAADPRPAGAVALSELGVAVGGDPEHGAAAGAPRLAWRIVVRGEEPGGVRESLVDARTGAILRERDLDVDGHWIGRGRVFDPNPVAFLGDPTLRDRDDADGPEFAPAYLEVDLPGLTRVWLDRFGPMTLNGPYVRVSDLAESPFMANATSPTGEFLFGRDQDGFENVMLYFHVDRAQRYIQSLGFGDVNNRAIRADPHGLRGARNAHYVGFPPGMGWMAFGTGVVDLAEDADVIWHEYGHAMQDHQNPGGYAWLGETGAQGEGFGDYWAYVNAALTNPALADPECIGEWAFEGACLRRTDGSKHYPEDIVREVHDDGEIWSALLRDIALATGFEAANRIVLESHFLAPMFPRFCAGVAALRDADDALYGGVHAPAIVDAAARRGFPAACAAVEGGGQDGVPAPAGPGAAPEAARRVRPAPAPRPGGRRRRGRRSPARPRSPRRSRSASTPPACRSTAPRTA